MVRRAIVPLSLLLLTCAHASPAHAPSVIVPTPTVAAAPAPSEPAPAPIPPHVAYPTPPAQNKPWNPPGRQTPLYLAAAKVFEQGMADPRTLPYREIELVVGDVWGGGGEAVKTHGWVLPGDQFAVAWNGLVYRVKSAGGPADLRADMHALFAEDEALIKKQRAEYPTWTPHRSSATAETYFISTTSVTPLKVALLLRVGEDALAQRMWSTLGEDQTQAGPYYAFVQDWTWSSYDRGVTAFMRRDDDLAIESLRALPALSPQVDAECDALAVQRQQRSDKKRSPCASFLDGVDELLVEAQRRTASPGTKLDDQAIAALSSLPQSQRIQKLIAALDQVAERQWGQPGGVSLGQDRVVQALIAEGEPAVEPLISVFENDMRLTRSVQFWRDFARYRSVLAVYEAAYVALSGILDASFFQAVSTGDHLTARGVEGRRAVGAKIREHWAKWKGVSLDERFYSTLMDDTASPAQWLTAASSITQPTNVQTIPSSNVWVTSTSTSLPAGQKPGLRGEALRSKTSPTVSELLAKRLNAIADPRAQCSFAQSFAAWDPASALPQMTATVQRGVAGYPSATDKASEGSCIAVLTIARIDAGDTTALRDYRAWLGLTQPEEGTYNLEQWFAPMLAHPKAPDIVIAANAVFGSGSPWVPFTSAKASFTRERILELPLWKVDAFKKHVIVELSDRTKIGTVKVRGTDNLEVKTEGFSGGRNIYPPDPDARTGQISDLRMCDEYADLLLSGFRRNNTKAPEFALHWPTAKKDRALVEIASFLNKQ